jgi:putative ABC transport system permease protein
MYFFIFLAYFLGLTVLCLLLVPMAFMVTILFFSKGRRSFVLAVRSLWLHKLRAFLSVLGIIIGTGAVILLMAFGEGSMQEALEDIKSQGATNIMIQSVKLPSESVAGRRTRIAKYGITHDDYEMLVETFAKGPDPVVTKKVPMRILRQEMRVDDRMHTGRLVGTEPDYADINNLQLVAGRFFTKDENDRKLNRVVLGFNTAKKLFPFTNAIGKTVSMGRFLDKHVVVGVLDNRKSRTTGSGSHTTTEDFNNDAYIPLQTCRNWYGERFIDRQSGSFSAEEVYLHQVTLTVKDLSQVRPTGEKIKEIMQKRHDNKDWEVVIPLDRLEAAERERDRFLILLAMIGGISLLVGGIGIMNIMLATVTERTREIGIRRALGAKRRDITLQFLVEAMVQTGIGGIVGVIVGLALMVVIPLIVSWFGGHLPAKLHIISIGLSLAVSVGVGILFGWYPARRAALLDPIEALRHE